METPEHLWQLRIVGGNLALDFLNTRGGAPEDEVLHGYDDLVAWGHHVGMLTEEEARRLLRRARRDPGTARATYERAVEVRDYLHDLFGAVAEGQPPPGRCTARLRSDEAEGLARAELVAAGEGLEWSWAHDHDLTRPLRPLVHAAVELLTTGPLELIKRCGGCPWLFLDESKNHSRRWCSMDDCGKVEKMRRYVARRAAARR
jgi:predicted RNA-binding Zn ribbon-like protein